MAVDPVNTKSPYAPLNRSSARLTQISTLSLNTSSARTGRGIPRQYCRNQAQTPGIDVVFPALHGTFGEDGTIQGLLDLAELPYVGAGVLASAVSMDKAVTKRLCKEAGLPVVEHVVLTRGQFDPECLQLPFPFPVFVKPSNLGSSVGITKAKNCRELARSARRLQHNTTARSSWNEELRLENLSARFSAAISRMASAPCEIFPSQEFYTYEDKYLLNQAVIQLPGKADRRANRES